MSALESSLFLKWIPMQDQSWIPKVIRKLDSDYLTVVTVFNHITV